MTINWNIEGLQESLMCPLNLQSLCLPLSNPQCASTITRPQSLSKSQHASVWCEVKHSRRSRRTKNHSMQRSICVTLVFSDEKLWKLHINGWLFQVKPFDTQCDSSIPHHICLMHVDNHNDLSTTPMSILFQVEVLYKSCTYITRCP